MTTRPVRSRRQFLGHTILPAAFAGSTWQMLGLLPPLRAEETKIDPRMVQLRPEIEPLVRLLETTPRELIVQTLVQRIRGGLSYSELLAALFLAGVRNVEPRPSVGLKFHAVLVVNAAHLTSISSPQTDRWFPLLWAVDNFKVSQAQDVKERDWSLAEVNEGSIPAASQCRKAFVEAMNKWDDVAADAAIAGLCRMGGVNGLFDLLAQYGARDLRSLGHKAIFVANAWRTLQVIGWQHSEPVLRSLTYALLNREGDPNPSENDLDQDRPWKRSEALAQTIRADWQQGRMDRGATEALLVTVRKGTPEEASQKVVEVLNSGVHPQSVYDALFAGAAELMMRQPEIPALHAVTTTNAVHYIYQTCGDDLTRRKLVLQNAAFLPLFREFMKSRGLVADVCIDQLEPEPMGGGTLADLLEAPDRMASVRQIIGLAADAGQAQAVMHQERRLIFLKGRDTHHYKFSSAVMEDYLQVSPFWRERLLAASALYLPGGTVNPLVDQVMQGLS